MKAKLEDINIYGKRRLEMKLSYNGLWKILIDNDMQKKDLINQVGISSTTIAKMGKGEKVSLDVIERICDFFGCNVGDVLSFESENDNKLKILKGKENA